jgi:O-antigen/teichoic acid export membrane protein
VSAPAATAPPAFGARAARGTLWTGVRHFVEYTLRLGSNLILTRLLFPEAFGLVALISALVMGLALFSDIGLTTSVVQSARGDDPRFLRTVWTLQVIRGVALWAMASALAVPMAWFYGEEQLRWLIPVSSLTALLAGFNSVSLMRMQRNIQLGRLAAIELSTQAITVLVTVGWAYLNPSVWSLVGGTLVGHLVRLVLSHALAQGAPFGFAWEREAFGQLIHFGKWIFVSTALFFLTAQTDRLLFAKLFSFAMLGVYGNAVVLSTLPVQLLWSVGTFVLLPTFSQQARAGEALGASYRRLQAPVLMLGGLPVVGLFACGPELIQILYDSRYWEAGWMLQLLAIGAWFQIAQTLSSNALLALGAPHWMATANAVKLGGMVALVPAGYALRGAGGAIAALAATEVFRWATFTFAAERRGLAGWRTEVSCTLVVLVAGLAGWLAVDALRSAGWGAIPRLCGGVAGLLAVWLPASALLLRSDLAILWARIPRRRGAPAG